MSLYASRQGISNVPLDGAPRTRIIPYATDSTLGPPIVIKRFVVRSEGGKFQNAPATQQPALQLMVAPIQFAQQQPYEQVVGSVSLSTADTDIYQIEWIPPITLRIDPLRESFYGVCSLAGFGATPSLRYAVLGLMEYEYLASPTSQPRVDPSEFY